MTICTNNITGVILAGGQGRRMHGEDKGLLYFDSHRLVETAIRILSPQVSSIIISANRNLPTYRQFGFPVVQDELAGFHGPLSGILTAIKQVHTDYLLTIPCDSPLLPGCLAERFCNTLEHHSRKASCAFDGKRLHPVVNLLHTSLAEDLQQYLDEGNRKLLGWLEQTDFVQTDFSDLQDRFLNLNSLHDIPDAESTYRSLSHV